MESEESVEVTALSVDEAIILGLTRLGVTRDEVDIQILDEGSRGFLGLGAREARVRLTRRRAKAPLGASLISDLAVLETPEPVAGPEPEPEPEVAYAAVEDVEAPPAEETVSDVDETGETQFDEYEPEPAGEAVATEEKPEKSPGVLERDMITEAALDIARNMFADLRLQVTAAWREEERPTLWISLHGRDANVLVGPKAQTLDAVQYLFRSLVHRRMEGDYNLVVDADGYRDRRRQSLEALARKMADQAVRSGRTVRMHPMPAHERRVIHMVLREDKRVQTESVGKGRDRAITIIPEKTSGR